MTVQWEWPHKGGSTVCVYLRCLLPLSDQEEHRHDTSDLVPEKRLSDHRQLTHVKTTLTGKKIKQWTIILVDQSHLAWVESHFV